MHRYVFLAAAVVAMMPSGPSFAIREKDKMETCKFGADDQKLEGAARTAFMKKCMANRNDPRGPAAGSPATPAAAPKQ